MTNPNDFHDKYLEQKVHRAIWDSPDIGCREGVDTYGILGVGEKYVN